MWFSPHWIDTQGSITKRRSFGGRSDLSSPHNVQNFVPIDNILYEAPSILNLLTLPADPLVYKLHPDVVPTGKKVELRISGRFFFRFNFYERNVDFAGKGFRNTLYEKLPQVGFFPTSESKVSQIILEPEETSTDVELVLSPSIVLISCQIVNMYQIDDLGQFNISRTAFLFVFWLPPPSSSSVSLNALCWMRSGLTLSYYSPFSRLSSPFLPSSHSQNLIEISFRKSEIGFRRILPSVSWLA